MASAHSAAILGAKSHLNFAPTTSSSTLAEVVEKLSAYSSSLEEPDFAPKTSSSTLEEVAEKLSEHWERLEEVVENLSAYADRLEEVAENLSEYASSVEEPVFGPKTSSESEVKLMKQ